MTSKIKKCAKCDFKDDKVTQSATQDIIGMTVAINSYLGHDLGNNLGICHSWNEHMD
jgi:hypothetical protein